MLLILEPLTVVLGSIQMVVDALAVRHVVHPLALVHSAVLVDETPMAVRLVHVPPAFVEGPIWPGQHAFASTDLRPDYPLPIEFRLIVEYHGGA